MHVGAQLRHASSFNNKTLIYFIMKKNFLMLAASLLMSAMAWATTYDETTLTNGDNSVTLSCLTDGNNNYQMIIKGEGLVGLGGSFAFKDGVGGYDIRTNMTLSSDNTTIICTWSSTTETYLHTPLYVLMPGEVNFGELSIDWKTVDKLEGVNSDGGGNEGEEEGEGNDDELPAGTIKLTSGANSILLTTTTDGNGNYHLVVTGTNLEGFGGSFWRTSDNTDGVILQADQVVADDKTTITIDVTSETAPDLYTPLYVLMPGEVNFGYLSLNWVVASSSDDTPTAISSITTDGTTTIYDLTGKVVKTNVNANAALNGLSRGTYIIKTAGKTTKAIVR